MKLKYRFDTTKTARGEWTPITWFQWRIVKFNQWRGIYFEPLLPYMFGVAWESKL